MAKDENFTAKFRIDVSDLKKGIEEGKQADQACKCRIQERDGREWTTGARARTVFRQKSNSSRSVVEAEKQKLGALERTADESAAGSAERTENH